MELLARAQALILLLDNGLVTEDEAKEHALALLSALRRY